MKNITQWFPIVLLFMYNSFAGMAQESMFKRINVDYKNAVMKDILTDLTNKTGVEFLYNQDEVKQVKPQTFLMKQMTVKEVLDRCFKETNLGYKFTEGMIVITANRTPQKVELVKIRGKVTETGNIPLTGATVVIKGTTIGVTTDQNGQYELSAVSTKNLVLVISFLGMKTQELKAFGNKNILVSLANIDPAFHMLADNEWGSDPNRLPEVQIRGAANISGLEDLQDNAKADLNTPLIIMDGFEISLQRLMDLNQNEVASVTLLKDGSATAIYGSRGANGVIVVTTKEPEAGKLKLSYTGNLNIEVPDLTEYHLLNARDKLELEYRSGYYSDSWDANGELKLKQKYSALLAEVERGVNTYWLSKPLRTGVGQRHSLYLGGGDKSFRYTVSLQYNNIAGVMKKSERNTFNGSIDLLYNHADLIFKNNIQVGVNKAIDSPYGKFSDYTKLNPYWRPYDDDGKLIKILDTDGEFWGGGAKLPVNPLYNATLNTKQTTDYLNITNNFSIEWKPLEGMILRGKIGVAAQFDDSDNFKPANHTDFEADEYKKGDGIFRKGRYIYSTGKTLDYDASFTFSYSKLFAEKHLVYVGLNYDLSDRRSRMYEFQVEGFVEETLDFLSVALQYRKDGKPTGSESRTRRIGLLGNVNYSYDSRYYVDGAFRMDGASQFGTDKRFAPFYSIGVGWNLHNEKFMEDLSFVGRLKLRGSYGQTGSQKFNAYQAKAVYAYYLNDRYFQWMGSYQKDLANPDLAWQKTDKWNIGFEADFLNNRLRLIADYYLECTSNLLSSMELPYSSGFTSYVQNVGKLQNKGFELKISGFLLRDTERRMIWSLTGAIAHNEDKIIKLSEAMKAENEKLALKKSFNPANIIREGDSPNTIYAVPSLGIDPSNGKELFLKKSGEVTYTWAAEDQVACGLRQPKYRGTFSTMFRYGDFSTNLSFAFRLGGKLYNGTLASRVENANKKYNVDERVYKSRWQKVGDRTFFKDINDELGTYATTRFVQKEKTLSCQNINITYDFQGKAWLKKYLGMEVLTFTGNISDVFYWSTIRQERGLSYPFSRRFSLSLTAIF